MVAAGACVTAHAFGFEDVSDRARRLSEAAYQQPVDRLPDALRKLSYEAYADIRFKPSQALWRQERLPFEVMFFHPGRSFSLPVRIHEIDATGAKDLRFDPNQFDYGANHVDPAALRDIGYAGFRVHAALNTPKYKDEVLVFLGASYLRALGKGQHYGLSARGLAIDVATAAGEEFPRFTEFWIEKPKAAATDLTIYALLDAPRLTGAYRFVLRPGLDTVLDVKVQLYARAGVTTLGVAPLTSMFLHGENQPSRSDDFRPEVHDSDGLSAHLGSGEWIWRPLVNPKHLLVTSFATTDPRGFGLMQRDRRFSSYEELDTRYDLRPSAWVEPKGRWGAGRIELVQIPSPDESNDNVVAYWVPDKAPGPKQRLDLEYRVLWQKDAERKPPTAWVAQTRLGHGYTPTPDPSVQYSVDFEGPALDALAPDVVPDADVSVGSNGELLERSVRRNDVTHGVRLTLKIKRIDPAKPVELRAVLKRNNEIVSETWSNILPRS